MGSGYGTDDTVGIKDGILVGDGTEVIGTSVGTSVGT